MATGIVYDQYQAESLINSAATGSIAVTVTSGGSAANAFMFLGPSAQNRVAWQMYGSSNTFINLYVGGYYYLRVKPAVGGSTPPTAVYSAWIQAASPATAVAVELNDIVYGGGGGGSGGNGINVIGISTV